MKYLVIVFYLITLTSAIFSQNDSTEVSNSSSVTDDSLTTKQSEEIKPSVEKGEWDFSNKVYKLESPPLFWQSPISIPDKFIVDSTLNITINKYILVKGKHYIYNSEDKLIYFNIEIDENDDIYIYYRAISAKVDDYYSLDSLKVYNTKQGKFQAIQSKKKSDKSELDIISGTSTLSFDFDKGGFNMNRYIDLTIAGTYNDSVNINGHIYDENVQDRYMYEKEVKDVQDLQIKVDNGHGYFIGGDYLQEDTSMIFYTSRELRGAKAEYSGKIKSIGYRANGYIGAESNVSIHERIDLTFGVKGPYEISEKNYYIEDIKIKFNEKILIRGEDYRFEEDKGFIYLNFYFDPGSYIDIEYIKREDNIGRNLAGGFVSLQKKALYIDTDVMKGFGGVEDGDVIKYLPGDTLAVVSGEERIDYDNVSYGAYKKVSENNYQFYAKSELSQSDTLYLLYFYESGNVGSYQVDEIETYKSNGNMEVYKYDVASSLSIYDVGRVVRIKDDFILVNSTIGLSADSIVNVDISKAELIRENSIYHAFYVHFDVSLDKFKAKRDNLPFNNIYVGNTLFYKDKDYHSVNNYRDYSFYYNTWNMENYEQILLDDDVFSFEKNEWENVTTIDIEFSRLALLLSPGFLHFGKGRSASDSKGVVYNVSKVNSKAELRLAKDVKLNGAIDLYSYNNWTGTYNKSSNEFDAVIGDNELLIRPFYNGKKSELGKKDSTFYRDHLGIDFYKKATRNLDFGFTLQSYHDQIESSTYNIYSQEDTLYSNQLLTNASWGDSLNSIAVKIDFFDDALKEKQYTNYDLGIARKTKKYNVNSTFNNTTELLEQSIYQHMYVGKFNGSYEYDEESEEFIFVGANVGDVNLYEHTSLVGDLTSNKRFLINFDSDYLISPFGNLDMLEISDEENLFPEYPSYEDILSRSELNSTYTLGASFLSDEDELRLYKKSSEFFKRYVVYDNDSNMYDAKYNLLYNFEEGYYLEKRFMSNSFTTNVLFSDRDRMAVQYNSVVDTSYVVNIVKLGYSSSYNLNNFIDILFGNSAELNRELKYVDNYEMLYGSGGVGLYFRLLTLNVLNEVSYRFGGNDNLNVPLYFNTYKKGFNYDLSINGRSQVTKKLSFQMQSLTRFRKGDDPWFQVVLDGSYSF